jgi:choline dehydrogenase-like flavoprotein
VVKKDWFETRQEDHGSSGPILTEAHKLCPIDERVLESFQDQGIPQEVDIFTRSHVPQGCDTTLRSSGNGFRSTSALYVTKDNLRSNLTIVCNACVDKVLFRDGSDGLPEAEAVEALLLTQDSRRVTYKASREIILSAGTYATPPILLRSGIGPSSELSKHSIAQVVALPVGQDMQDHVIVQTNYEVNTPKLTTDHQVWHADALPASYAQYATNLTGWLTAMPYGPFAWLRLDSSLADSPAWTSATHAPNRDPMGQDPTKQPSVEIWSTECYLAHPEIYGYHFPVDGSSVFGMVAKLFGPLSRGSVTLRSTDPTAYPVVHNNYFSDTAGLDVLLLAEALRTAHNIAIKGKGTKDVIAGPWPRELDAKKNPFELKTREDWIQYTRDHATTCYHPSSTCRMGKAEDKSTVVDEKLKVKGVKGLRVVDVSILPKLINGHTQMIAYAIGEKAADMIKADL